MFVDKQPDEQLCKVMQERSKLSERDAEILDTALADKRWSHYSLFLELRRNGFRVAQETLKLHRKGVCICSKT